MEWWDTVRLSISAAIAQHGLLAGFVVILIEEMGVPVPVPGDFLMIGLGVHAREGHVALWQALLVMEVATLTGASILYFVSLRAGRDLVYRYGRYIHLTPARLDKAELWLRQRGPLAIVVGRVTPGLRMATVIASGIFGVPYHQFLPALAVGGFAYIVLYTLLGYFVGPPVLRIVEGIHLPLGLVGSVLPLALLVFWVVRARRALHLRQATHAESPDPRHRWRDGAIAGFLATLISTLTMNVLINLIGDVTLLEPGGLVQRMQARLAALVLVRVIGPFLLLMAVPAFVLVGMAWGAVYAEWIEPHMQLPDWLKGLAFALLPLAVALVFVLPVLDDAAPDLGRLGPLAAASEALRHACYGVALGVIYPLRLARFSRTRAPADEVAPARGPLGAQAPGH
ncbi:MAG: DedA family protein [Chloroflexi bacterium]|nr:DedA family protein [Chloroflexota bacterium]MBV9600806.1 DedA family protein [Chloroflexota bacterium]